MSYNIILDTTNFENNLTSIADTLRTINGTNEKMVFPEGFCTNINTIINSSYGIRDLIVNDESRFTGSMINNAFVNFSTVSTGDYCAFFFKKPVITESGDVVKLIFSNKSGTVGYSRVQMFTAPYGLLDLNTNFNLGTSGSITIQTTISKNKIEIYGLNIGPRHTTAWKNFQATLHFYVNDT